VTEHYYTSLGLLWNEGIQNRGKEENVGIEGRCCGKTEEKHKKHIDRGVWNAGIITQIPKT
jgi:hypothetical protein